MLTLVKSVKKKIKKKPPRMALTPTTSGMAEATSAPNTNASRRKVSGIEMASASARSLAIFAFMACAITPPPVAYTFIESNLPSNFC